MGVRKGFAVLVISAGVAGCAGNAVKSEADSHLSAGAGDSGTTVGTLSDSGVAGDSLVAKVVADSGGDAGLDLKQSVFYEFDRYDVKPEYRALVERHAAWLRANPRARLVVTGNTDERGPTEYNLALGQRRAESVTRMLKVLGAREEQIEAVSFGKEKPRAVGHDESAWEQNRRSDFSAAAR